jgi:hypothetical protein
MSLAFQRFRVLAITSLGGTTRARRFRPYDGQNGRLRFINEKSLCNRRSFGYNFPRTSRAPLLPAEAGRLWGPEGAGRMRHCVLKRTIRYDTEKYSMVVECIRVSNSQFTGGVEPVRVRKQAVRSECTH